MDVGDDVGDEMMWVMKWTMIRMLMLLMLLTIVSAAAVAVALVVRIDGGSGTALVVVAPEKALASVGQCRRPLWETVAGSGEDGNDGTCL